MPLALNQARTVLSMLFVFHSLLRCSSSERVCRDILTVVFDQAKYTGSTTVLNHLEKAALGFVLSSAPCDCVTQISARPYGRFPKELVVPMSYRL
jgi:hypothetical protein